MLALFFAIRPTSDTFVRNWADAVAIEVFDVIC